MLASSGIQATIKPTWRPRIGVRARRTVVVLLGLAGASCAGGDVPRGEERTPLVIAHRGASGYLPEHTLEAYALAIALGADYVEPDVVMTRDGHLIARHEPNITNTTDVWHRPEFASRRRSAVVDGVTEEGWFASDFTLAEIGTVRAVQAFAERAQGFNGRFAIPTLTAVIELVRRESRARGRAIGIYVEVKHPTYHRALGLPLEPALAGVLRSAGWDGRDAPVFVQSFEPSALAAVRALTGVRLVQLVDASGVGPDGALQFDPPADRPYDWTASGDSVLLARRYDFFATDEGLREIRRYADGIGPWKRYIVSAEAGDRRLGPPTDLVARAHAAGLVVHPWTFRSDRTRLAADYDGQAVREYLQFYRLGVDGVFTDFPDAALTARALFQLSPD